MGAWYESAMFARVLYTDGTTDRIALEYSETGGLLTSSFPDGEDWNRILRIDYAPEMGQAQAGEPGYYVIPHGQESAGDSFLCRFRERENCEMVSKEFVMPMWGCTHPGGSFMATVSSMTYDYSLVTSVRDGIYTNYPRFCLEGRAPYEPIQVEYRLLGTEADYNDVALAYRRWRENRGEIQPYRDRAEHRSAARYTAESIYIRIRQGWKPVPPPVPEQTPENEPEMHVASTFRDVSDLLEAFQARDIDRAEFCLVGWNKSGHDGRWPQAFPVEERLGGEEELRKLTEKAKRMGYAMVCHTNSTDAYSIADVWKETDIIRREDGSKARNEQPWSGGDMYWVCPECGLRQARKLLPEIRRLGFSGTHYIDVISTVFPRACHDPEHPVNRRECVRIWNRILRTAKDTFGGISSEGGYDFAAPELDYGLYVSFGLKDCPLADDCIPLWQLVYHGYILSNPYTKTVNPTEEQLLKVTEYGGRPTFYYDSQFVTPDPDKDVNWMGAEDFHCHTRKEREESADYIARVYRWYRQVRYLQYVPMVRHEILPDGKRRVTYENGDVIMVDYGEKTAFLNGVKILPMQAS